jgi:hypothetical protein
VRKLAPALAALILLVICSPAMAHNWGADPSNQVAYCSDSSPDSECSADNSFHYVYYNSIPANIRTAFNDSLATDYYVLYEAFAEETTDVDVADVVVRMEDTPNNVPAAYTRCSTSATYGASGWNRWCKRQVIVLDDNDPQWGDGCFNGSSNGCRNWVACHETGHTLGLQHTGRSSSCMTTDGPDGTQTKNLDGHDIEHLADCYPHPTGSALTTDCYEYQNHY